MLRYLISIAGLHALAAGNAAAALPDNFNPADYAKPRVCAEHFKLDASTTLCQPPAVADIAQLGEAACKAASFTYDTTARTCTPGAAK